MNILLSQLKEMNLDGMYQALSRLQEMGDAQASLSMPVLSRLIEAEAECRRDRKSQSLAKRARFRYHASLQSVATGIDRNLDRSLVDRLAEGRWIKQGQSLLITGPTGAGKSYLASALGQQACRQGFRTLYFNCNKLWYQLRQSRSRDRYEKEIRTISKAELLVLDDFGLGKLEASDRLSLLEILEDRWGQSATVVVSQRPLSSWHEILGEPTVADAICDRLFSNSEKIELKGDSLRKSSVNLDPNLPPH